MWCSTCQQDTPGVAHASTGRIVCSRCQQPIRGKKHVPRARVCDEGIALDECAAESPASVHEGAFRHDDWPARERMRSLARQLRRPHILANSAERGGSRSIFAERHRFEPPHDLTPTTAASPTSAIPDRLSPPTHDAGMRPQTSVSSQIFAWLCVLAGAVALVGGIGVVASSLATQDMQYWNLGLGLTLGGQGTLILGLVIVASRFWRHSRYAAGKLQDMHTRLVQVQQSAELLTTMRAGGGAPAFYAELARGSNPHVLLSNLKGQLDQLATRIGA